ncbi:MAG: ABC transporter ATP-binding protein [Candidatus Marinimicrobia bacterium]|nr:ABC transporter ATP-binding protein [Candidatus Neomarinimicrobiota bacterium]
MIKTEALSKVFRTEDVETTALNQIDLNIEQGEFVSIMGPSGCGKSTLMNVLGLLDNPSSGKYHFLDSEVSGYNERERADFRKANIGFVFQSFNLIEELSVFENVELPLIYQGVPASERKERVMKMLEKMGVGHRHSHFPQQLSGGQQQRVAVSRALITDPKIVLADEPTGNLDSHHGDEVMNLLKDLNQQGTTIVMVTHSPAYAAYGNRTVNLFDGKIADETLNGNFHV